MITALLLIAACLVVGGTYEFYLVWKHWHWLLTTQEERCWQKCCPVRRVK